MEEIKPTPSMQDFINKNAQEFGLTPNTQKKEGEKSPLTVFPEPQLNHEPSDFKPVEIPPTAGMQDFINKTLNKEQIPPEFVKPPAIGAQEEDSYSLQKFSQDIYGITDPVRQIPNIVRGMGMAVEETSNFINQYLGFGEILRASGLPAESHVLRDLSPSGELKDDIVKSGAQFLLPYGAAMKTATWGAKLIQGAEDLGKLWKYGTMTASVFTSSYVAFSPKDQNLANLIAQYPGMIQPIAEFLATDEKDSDSINRLRNATVNTIFGIGIDATIFGTVATTKAGIWAAKNIPNWVSKGFYAIKKPPKEIRASSLTPDEVRSLDEAETKIAYELPTTPELTLKQLTTLEGKRFVQNTMDEMFGGKLLDIAAAKAGVGEKYTWETLKNTYTSGFVVDHVIRAGGGIKLRKFEIDNSIPDKWKLRDKDTHEEIKVFNSAVEAEQGLRHYQKHYGIIPTGTKSLLQIIKPAIATNNYKNLSNYMLAVRMKYLKQAKGRTVKNKETGVNEFVQFKVPWTDEHIRVAIKNGEDIRVNYKGEITSVSDIGNEFLQLNKELVEFFHDSGMVSALARDDMIGAGIFIPLYRLFEDKHGVIPGRMVVRGMGKGKAGKRLSREGTEEYLIQDPLQSLVANYSSIIDVSIKNRAWMTVVDAVDELRAVDEDLANSFLVEEPKLANVITSDIKTILRRLKNEGVDVDPNTVNDPDYLIAFFNKRLLPVGNDIQIGFRDGKAVTHRVVDEFMLKTVGALGPRAALDFPRFILRPFQGLKTFLTNMVTIFPNFIGRNTARDPIEAFLLSQSKKGFLPYWDTARGVKAQFDNDPDYVLYKLNGGMGGNRIHGDDQTYIKKLQKYHSLRGFSEKQIQSFHTFTEWWGKLLGVPETANRLAEFKQLIKEGELPAIAGFKSREVVTDFLGRGSNQNLRLLTTTVPFLSAGINGMYRFGRAVSGKDVKRLAVRFTSTLVPVTLGLYALNYNNPRYNALPDWVKNANWVFDLNDSYELINYISPEMAKGLWENTQYPGFLIFPKPFEFGGMLSVIERLFDAFRDLDPSGFFKDFADIFLETFRMNFDPQALSPAIDTFVTNTSWTGSPITPDYMKDVEAKWQIKPYTSPVTTWMGQRGVSQLTGISPIQLEYLWDGYTGTTGSYILDAMDDFARVHLNGGESPETGFENPTSRFEDIPGLGVFYKNDPLGYTQDQVDFYKIYKAVTKINNTLAFVQRPTTMYFQNLDQITSYMNNPDNLKVNATINIFKDTMQIATVLNEAIQLTTHDPAMSGKQKRQNIDDYKSKINKLFRTTMLTIKNTPQLRDLIKYQHGGVGKEIYSNITIPLQEERDKENIQPSQSLNDYITEMAKKHGLSR